MDTTRYASAIALALATASPSWADVEVNTCGQSLSGSGHLSGDLDCSVASGDSVLISNGRLDLRGFTLSGNVSCPANCIVYSSGARGRIVFSGYAVSGDPPDRTASVEVENVEIEGGGVRTTGAIRVVDSVIRNCPGVGVVASDTVSELGGRALVERSVIDGCAEHGVLASGNVRIKGSEVTSNGMAGVFAFGRIIVDDCRILANDDGVTSLSSVKVTDSEVSTNVGVGVVAGMGGVVAPDVLQVTSSEVSSNGADGLISFGTRTLKVVDSVVNGNGGHGVNGDIRAPVSVTRSTISGNAMSGVYLPAGACRFKAREATLTDNGTDPGCGGATPCADIATCGSPNVVTTVCETSANLSFMPSSPTWGVCSLD